MPNVQRKICRHFALVTDIDEYPLDDLLMECEEDDGRHLENNDSLIEGLYDPQTKEISKEGETKDDTQCIWCDSLHMLHISCSLLI